MNPWTESAVIVGAAAATAAITLGWIGLWQYLNIEKRWPIWACLPAALSLPLLALWVLIAQSLIHT